MIFLLWGLCIICDMKQTRNITMNMLKWEDLSEYEICLVGDRCRSSIQRTNSFKSNIFERIQLHTESICHHNVQSSGFVWIIPQHSFEIKLLFVNYSNKLCRFVKKQRKKWLSLIEWRYLHLYYQNKLNLALSLKKMCTVFKSMNTPKSIIYNKNNRSSKVKYPFVCSQWLQITQSILKQYTIYNWRQNQTP